MDTNDSLLIVDDDVNDFMAMIEELEHLKYVCFPKNTEYEKFFENCKNFLFGDSNTVQKAKKNLDEYFTNTNVRVIILDIDLLGAKFEDDQSGIRFMRFLRKYYRWVPIIILTRYTPSEIDEAFEIGTRVFYLEKYRTPNESRPEITDEEIEPESSDICLKQKALYKPFITNVIDPVLRMLMQWDQSATIELQIKSIFNDFKGETIKEFDRRFGIVEEQLDYILDNDEYLIKYSDICLSALRYLVIMDDSRAGKVLDNILQIEGLQKIIQIDDAVKYQIESSRDELINAIMGKSDLGFYEKFRLVLKNALNCKSNDEIINKSIKIIMKHIAKNTKIVNIAYDICEDLTSNSTFD